MYADWIQGCLDEDDARATDYQTWDALDDAEQTHYLSQARAAFLAMIEAWPGMRDGWMGVATTATPALILPIMENPDDKA